MKTVILFLAVLLSGIVLVAQPINDPNAELREAKNFHVINVSSSFDVYISQSKEEAVAVSGASSKDKENIKVEVKEGVLYVRYEGNSKWGWNSGNKKLKVYISFKNIDKLLISGACNVFFTDIINVNELTINQSGASDLKGNLNVNYLHVDLNGASDVTLSGTAKFLSVEVNGASDFKGYDLVSVNCVAKASGASDIRVTVNKELSAEASGASDIKYKGNGVIIDKKSSGSSSVSKG